MFNEENWRVKCLNVLCLLHDYITDVREEETYYPFFLAELGYAVTTAAVYSCDKNRVITHKTLTNGLEAVAVILKFLNYTI